MFANLANQRFGSALSLVNGGGFTTGIYHQRAIQQYYYGNSPPHVADLQFPISLESILTVQGSQLLAQSIDWLLENKHNFTRNFNKLTTI